MRINKSKIKRDKTSILILKKSAEDVYLEEQEQLWEEKNWYSHMRYK
ncbi:MAG: hypothetical protein AAF378_00650 [Cyanobacteria bacterium P01_A01_bin.84]